jgi:type II secretory pathway pseudopilin PulG
MPADNWGITPMKAHTQTRKPFTLVELMVVAIIVAILAAVAIPLMSGSKKRAMATEAEAGLGTIRTLMRANYAETSDYSKDSNGDAIVTVADVPGLALSDLDGKYFTSGNYSFSSGPSATGYTAKATGAGDLLGTSIELDQDGNFSRVGF